MRPFGEAVAQPGGRAAASFEVVMPVVLVACGR